MEKSIDTYLEFQIKTKKLSENTVLSYRRDLYAFSEYLKTLKINYLKVKKTDIYDIGCGGIFYPVFCAREQFD